MRFYLDKGAATAVAEHDGVKLAFTWRQYRSKNRNEVPIFGVINNYFASLPMETQGNLFDALSEIYQSFHNTTLQSSQSLSEYIAPLAEKVGKFYAHIDREAMRRWCVFNGGFHYPDDLKTEYGRFESTTTYLVQDYQGLLFLSTLLKPMTLIWSEFITRIKDTTGNDRKELVALPLISRTGIQQMEEYKKLQDYANAITSGAAGTVNCVFGGMGTADLPDWGVASVIIRRLAPGEVTTPTIALIKIIHGHLDQNVNNPASLEGRGGKKRMCERRPPSENSGSKEEDRTSVAENGRFRQQQPDHIPAINETYVDDMERLILKVEPEYPIRDPRWGLYNSPAARNYVDAHDVEILHRQLMAIVFRKSIFPRNILRIQHSSMANMLLVAQALMKYWDFPGLAHLLTAKSTPLDQDTVRDLTGQAIPAEILEELSACYPHWQARGRPEARNRKPLRHNYGMVFIENFTDTVNTYNWHYHSPEWIYDDRNLNGTFMQIPTNLRTELAQLLIKLMQR